MQPLKVDGSDLVLQKIRERICFLGFAFGGGLLAFCYLVLKIMRLKLTNADPFLPVVILAVMATSLLFVSLIREYRKHQFAQLITENQILHIQAARIEEVDANGDHTPLQVGGIEVVISCFGILLDSKVIKFNIDRIKLKNVEIGHKCICLSYGTKKRTQRVRILHGGIDQQELQTLIERFRYETGVVPVKR